MRSVASVIWPSWLAKSCPNASTAAVRRAGLRDRDSVASRSSESVVRLRRATGDRGAVGRQLHPGRGDPLRQGARKPVPGRAGLQPPRRGLAVAPDRDLGEQLLHGDRVERRVVRQPAQEGLDEGPRRPPSRRRRDHDAPMIGEERVLEVDEGEPGQQLLCFEYGIARHGRETCPERGVARHRRDGGAMAQVEVEGLGEGVVAPPALRQVGAVEDQLRRARHLHPAGEIRRVTLGETRSHIHPGSCARVQPRRAQQGVPAIELGLDFAGDARFGQRRHVDRDVGLLQHFRAVQPTELVQRTGAGPAAPVQNLL